MKPGSKYYSGFHINGVQGCRGRCPLHGGSTPTPHTTPQSLYLLFKHLQHCNQDSTLVCSGMISAELNGKPCPYAQNGRLTDLVPLDENDPSYTPDKGKPGDLCPPCVKQQLAHLGHWQGYGQQTLS